MGALQRQRCTFATVSFPIFDNDWHQKNQRLYGSSGDFELDTTLYIKESAFDKSVSCVTMVLGVGMLVGPLWWLQDLSTQDVEARLAINAGFLIAFIILLSIETVARPFEILAATVAYGAALMIFMQRSTRT